MTDSALRTPNSALRQRVLIIGPSNIGDAILMSDVVAILAQQFPHAHHTLLVGQRAHALFTQDPRIQTLVELDACASLLGRLKLALALWRYQPHVIVDLRHTVYPCLLKPLQAWRYLQPPPARVTHMRKRHLWKLARQVPGLRQAPMAGGTGGSLWRSSGDETSAQTLLSRWKLDGSQRLVVICPGARSHIKRWSAEGFARVADRLIREAGVQVIFSGEPEEEEIVETVRDLMEEQAFSAVGLTTIRQAGSLMRRASLVITNDSASLHLASALEVPTVAIFGPTDDAKYGPTAPRSRTIRRRLFCAPCEQALCRFSHECMRFVSADEVYEAARKLLEGRRKMEEGGKGRAGHA